MNSNYWHLIGHQLRPKGDEESEAYGLLISTLYIVISCVLAIIFRKLIKKIFSEESSFRTLALELLASWELCACCFELCVVADNYGIWTYALYLFMLTIYWAGAWDETETACPYIHFEDMVQGKVSISWAGARAAAELIGGIFVFGYIRVLWSLELTKNHRGKAFEECTADLQVAAILGALIEGFATCLCRIASKAIARLQLSRATEVEAFIGTALVVAAFNYSGGYFNPVLATSLKYGCRGHTAWEHILVYWIGSSLGAVASVFVFPHWSVQSTIDKLTSSLSIKSKDE